MRQRARSRSQVLRGLWRTDLTLPVGVNAADLCRPSLTNFDMNRQGLLSRGYVWKHIFGLTLLMITPNVIAVCWQSPDNRIIRSMSQSNPPVVGAITVPCPPDYSTYWLYPPPFPISSSAAYSTPITPMHRQPTGRVPHVTKCGNSAWLRGVLQIYEAGQAATNGISFDAACASHDECYGDKGGSTKKSDCDRKFLEIALITCKQATVNESTCASQARNYFNAIARWGGRPFCLARGTCEPRPSPIPYGVK